MWTGFPGRQIIILSSTISKIVYRLWQNHLGGGVTCYLTSLFVCACVCVHMCNCSTHLGKSDSVLRLVQELLIALLTFSQQVLTLLQPADVTTMCFNPSLDGASPTQHSSSPPYNWLLGGTFLFYIGHHLLLQLLSAVHVYVVSCIRAHLGE